MSLLLTHLRTLVGNVKRCQLTSDSSTVRGVEEKKGDPGVSETRGREPEKANAESEDWGSKPISAKVAPETTLDRGNERASAAHHHVSAHMISVSASRPPKGPLAKTLDAKAPATSAPSNASSGQFDILLYPHGPSEEHEEEFWRDFCRYKMSISLFPGQPEWDDFVPGTRVYEKFFNCAVRRNPPLGGCIYCPFKEMTGEELLHLDSVSKRAGYLERMIRSTNASNREDWERRRWAAQRNAGEDLVPDWAGIIACDDQHERRKHEQLVAWGFAVDSGSILECGVEGNDGHSSPSASPRPASCGEWLRRTWSFLGIGASRILEWVLDCASLLYSI